MLKEQKALYDAGFAIHLLRPKSKAPLESAWTKGPRKSWTELLRKFKTGMNVGVRLGEASQLDGRYLAVIDIDIKSKERKYRDEAYSFVKKLLPDFSEVTARSGRGNGSGHVYGTTQEPCGTRRLGQSKEVVRVKMPSTDRYSRTEETRLSKADLADGWRLRPAWEVSIMGEGSQVVLPPSIHPDTGARYEWSNGWPTDQLRQFDKISSGNAKAGSEVATRQNNDGNFEELDLLTSSLPADVCGQIIDGDDVEDRSAALMSVSLIMFRHGFTESQVVSVLTDKNYFLGKAAFEHAQTSSRVKAAQWLRRYTLTKAKAEVSAAAEFDIEELEIDEPAVTLTPEKAEAQRIEITGDDWRDQIERVKDKESPPKATMKNIVVILKGEYGEKDKKALFSKNLFTHAVLCNVVTPWGGRQNSEITDEHVVRLKKWFADVWRFEPPTDRINEAITCIAAENSFHPVRDYLETLEWDGTPRVGSWLRDYCAARAQEPYLTAVSTKTLVAMVARIYEPGKKFDQVLILEGNQGYGKSTLVKNLASEEWFSDSHINITDKDTVLSLRGNWIHELGELSGMRKADVDALKEFISRTHDRIRVPYGRRTESFPRQGIFIGTTNSDEYLKDVTGNRRFWPVKVGRCDFQAISRDRNQLLAEALVHYECGEPLYLEDRAMDKAAQKEQDARMVHDMWTEKLLRFLEKPSDTFNVNKFTIWDAIQDDGPFAGAPEDRATQLRIGDTLRRVAFVKFVSRDEKGNQRKFWRPKREDE